MASVLKIGFIGLGEMGKTIVERLLQHPDKYSVIGYNRTASKSEELRGKGMQVAGSPREVAEASDIIFSILTNGAAVASVLFTPETGVVSGLSAGKLVVEMSTMDPHQSEQFARQVSEACPGARMVDSPISGSSLTVAQGKASFMVGADVAGDFDRVQPILLDIGARCQHVGGNGRGAALKLALNLNLAIQMQGLSEGLLLAEKSGVPRDVALSVFASSAVASPMIVYRGPFTLQLPQHPLFSCEMMKKDLDLALALGHKVHVPLPSTALVNQTLTAAQAIGYGASDMAALFCPLALSSALPLPPVETTKDSHLE